jgi:antitoxin component YwqK of YwqJK toxin-antitoxin module
MLKTLLITLLGIIVLQDANAQKQSNRDTLIYYFKNSGQSANKSNADFTLLILPNKGQSTLYPVLELYANGKTKLTAASQVQSIDLVLEGPAMIYYPNGTSRNANYTGGKLNGEMTDYYPNGNKSKIITYRYGVLTGTVTDYYPNGKLYLLRKFDKNDKLNYVECRDSTGVILAEKGNGKWLEFNEDFKNVTKQGTIKDGLLIVPSIIAVNRPAENKISDDEYNKTGDVLMLENADKQPEFPNGSEAFSRFLVTTLHYPAVDFENGIKGKVFVSFIVEKDGHLSNIKALRGPSQTLKDEAIRTISLSPKWTPGLKNGVSARVTYIFPINFTIGEENRNLTKDVFSEVEQQPEFPGGLEEFGRFLFKNLKMPEADKDKGTSGKVIIQFVVEKDGSLTDIQAKSGPSETVIKEAIRVIQLSPKWKPGNQNGNPVRVRYTVPINFENSK